MKHRIEKMVANNTNYSRLMINKMLKKGKIKVNDIVVYKSCYVNVDDIITVDNQNINTKLFYLALNKPKGYICANADAKYPSVLHLISDLYRFAKNIHTVGRLDVDTHGLLIITNDGAFTHRVLSPKNHIQKVYLVQVDKELDVYMIEVFKQGIDIGEAKVCQSAKLEIIDRYNCYLTINEGKYHQVKRMFNKLGYKVIDLKRVAFGMFILPDDLSPGEYISINKDQII
ncbi:pseudouridine synthase [Mycoplasma sp. 6243]|uniref:pseudouridine synthase n=1 Tax=Mycoplasma sp. 6243 TaxID=3440865 RepID=UPI003EC04816